MIYENIHRLREELNTFRGSTKSQLGKDVRLKLLMDLLYPLRRKIRFVANDETILFLYEFLKRKLDEKPQR